MVRFEVRLATSSTLTEDQKMDICWTIYDALCIHFNEKGKDQFPQISSFNPIVTPITGNDNVR